MTVVTVNPKFEFSPQLQDKIWEWPGNEAIHATKAKAKKNSKCFSWEKGSATQADECYTRNVLWRITMVLESFF